VTTATIATTPLLSLEDALGRMLAGIEPLPTEQATLVDGLGLVVAESVIARHTLPPWDNSAMDGFAVRAADLAGATPQAPVRLSVIGESAAGRRPTASASAGTCLRILTGAPMPEGADAVVPIEDTDAEMGTIALPAEVSIRTAVPAGAHVRRAGSDVRAGTTLLQSGVVIGPAEAAVAAAGGHASVTVHRRPRVAILATGDELVAPGDEPGEAQIPDSNTTGLLAQALSCAADAVSLGIAGDSLEEVLRRLREGVARADVIIVSGGVSVGAHDVVKDAFATLGTLELWRVAVQPGKPLAFARAPRPGGQGRVLLFGLPGNPVSSFVTFELFVRPVLARLAGHVGRLQRDVVRARLAEPVSKSPGRRAFLRVSLARNEDGWQASLAGGQGSHVLSALAAADGLAIVGEEHDSLPAGANVEVILLRRPGG
jgi:molybdopterin molybdotransferase